MKKNKAGIRSYSYFNQIPIYKKIGVILRIHVRGIGPLQMRRITQTSDFSVTCQWRISIPVQLNKMNKLYDASCLEQLIIIHVVKKFPSFMKHEIQTYKLTK
jgi:hypothetical protein